jgi:hypothetical protein
MQKFFPPKLNNFVIKLKNEFKRLIFWNNIIEKLYYWESKSLKNQMKI